MVVGELEVDSANSSFSVNRGLDLDIDPEVRGFLKPVDLTTLEAPRPLDSRRFGVAPILTTAQFLSARAADTGKVGFIAEKMPSRDDLFVDLDTVPGGLIIPFVAAVINGGRERFHPDKPNITASQFREAAATVFRAMKAGKKKDLTTIFHDRKGVAR